MQVGIIYGWYQFSVLLITRILQKIIDDMSRIAILVLWMLGAVAGMVQNNSEATSVEQCNNGIDDDGDGFIDYYDADCQADPNNPNEYIVDDYECQAEPVGNQFDISVSWQSANQTSAVFGMPMVADIDNDGTPEVISSNASTGRIFLLNGEDGTTERSADSNLGALFGYPAVADVDTDGTGELFVVDDQGYLKAYNHDLSNYWNNKRSVYTSFGRQLGLADFDGDGNVELYQVNEIRDARTGEVLIAGSHGHPLSGVG